MAQTAVEWYIEQHKILSSEIRDMPISQVITKIKSIEQQAKQMEKEQHQDTWLDSAASYYGDDYIGKQQTFDEYYTQTYNQNK